MGAATSRRSPSTTSSGFPGSDPYIIAWVSIDEQPDVRLTTNLVDIEPDDVRIGMPVRVLFEHAEDVWLPLFTPVEDAS